MRISDWSSDVCSSDLGRLRFGEDRRELRLDAFKLLRALQLEQLELGLVARFGIGDDLVDQARQRADDAIENAHGRFLRLQAKWRKGRVSRAPEGAAYRILTDTIGRAHVCTPVTKAHLVCRLQLEK